MKSGDDRERLLKAVPDSIPDLITQFGATYTSEQDQLVLTSIGIELNAAGLHWHDLANLIRFQVVAHRKATVAGMINAAKCHPNAQRLTDWDRKFLTSVAHRKGLLTERQLACLQSITDSLELDDDAYALLVLSLPTREAG